MMENVLWIHFIPTWQLSSPCGGLNPSLLGLSLTPRARVIHLCLGPPTRSLLVLLNTASERPGRKCFVGQRSESLTWCTAAFFGYITSHQKYSEGHRVLMLGKAAVISMGYPTRKDSGDLQRWSQCAVCPNIYWLCCVRWSHLWGNAQQHTSIFCCHGLKWQGKRVPCWLRSGKQQSRVTKVTSSQSCPTCLSNLF